jgi:hypothetical protein
MDCDLCTANYKFTINLCKTEIMLDKEEELLNVMLRIKQKPILDLWLVLVQNLKVHVIKRMPI